MRKENAIVIARGRDSSITPECDLIDVTRGIGLVFGWSVPAATRVPELYDPVIGDCYHFAGIRGQHELSNWRNSAGRWPQMTNYLSGLDITERDLPKIS